MSKHDPLVRLRHMLDHARETVSITAGKTFDDLGDDRLLDLALLHLITIIGEAANRIPKETRDKYPEIEWSQIVGMRNRLVHGYDEIEYDILWQTVTEDLPRLITALEKIVPPDEAT